MSYRILVVDDDHDNADSFGMLLQRLGHTVQIAYDGQGALLLVETFGPRVAFVDLAMPGFSGLDFAKMVSGRGVFLVAVTGLTDKSYREHAKAAGFNAYMLKPLNLPDLNALLASVPADHAP